MLQQHAPKLAQTATTLPLPTTNPDETDEEFLVRQFAMSVCALERVAALSPGEFDRLVQSSSYTEEERRLRSEQHFEIARRTFSAARQNAIAEEEFNIWSGRRKENGQPVKLRFERAYERHGSPLFSRQRGALTGIIRAYIALQDEFIADLLARGKAATTAGELFIIEQQAVESGFLAFEFYTDGSVAGWPCFPRSTGHFRGAVRLREYFEQRQATLPLTANAAARIRQQALQEMAHPDTVKDTPIVRECPAATHSKKPRKPLHLKQLISHLLHLFQ